MNLNTIQITLFYSLLLSYPWANQSFSIYPSTNPRLYSFKTVATTSSTSSTTRTTKLQLASSHQELFDAEEAAALDAHDVSDAGLEAAMMETAVMTADEIFRSQHHKKESPTKKFNQPTSQATSSELPYEDFVEHKFHFEKDFMESSTNDIDQGHTVIESLANLIKDVDE